MADEVEPIVSDASDEVEPTINKPIEDPTTTAESTDNNPNTAEDATQDTEVTGQPLAEQKIEASYPSYGLGSGAGGYRGSGGWFCVGCNTNNFPTRDKCRGCGTPRKVENNHSKESLETYVDDTLMTTQTNLLIIGFLRREFLHTNYQRYEISIIKIIIQSLGNIFNMKRLWNEMTKQKYNMLMDWLRLNKAEFNNFGVREVNGLYAISPTIETGTVFASIPRKCILTRDIATQSSIGQQIGLKDLRSRQTYLAAYIAMERKKGTDSFWYPYIQSLPTEFAEIPVYFSEGEIDGLKGSFTIQKILDRKESLRLEYNNLSEIFKVEGISYDDFVWGRLVVITRVFGMVVDHYKTSGLVPFVDLIDHAPPAPNRVKWTYKQESDSFVVLANSNMNVGDELFVTYGRKCNSRFFVNYGFVLEDNADNEAVLTFELDANNDAMYTKKARHLGFNVNKIGLDTKKTFQIAKQYETRKVKQAFSWLRVACCFEEEFYKFVENNDKLFVEGISIKNELVVLAKIKQCAQNALNEFEHSLEFDNELLSNEKDYPRRSNKRNIVLMRKSEKEVLRFYVNLKAKVFGLFAMTFSELEHKLNEQENKEKNNLALMQYINNVIVPLKRNERDKKVAIVESEEKKENVNVGIYDNDIEIAMDDDINNKEKWIEINDKIKQLLQLNQEKDEQIKLLNDKFDTQQQEIHALNDKLSQILQQNINNNDNNVDVDIDIASFFKTVVDLPQYIDLFIENGFNDIHLLTDITGPQLKELGIVKMGHQKRILKAIQQINLQNT